MVTTPRFNRPNGRDPGDRIVIAMSERQISLLIEALHDQRDPTGQPAGGPERALTDAIRTLEAHNAFEALAR